MPGGLVPADDLPTTAQPQRARRGIVPMDDLPEPQAMPATYEGRPIVQQPDKSWSHEKSISIEADGKHMNIPTMFGGKDYTPDQAVEIMRKNKWIDPDTGKPVPTFKSQQEAVTAAQAKEARQQMPAPPKPMSELLGGAEAKIQRPGGFWRTLGEGILQGGASSQEVAPPVAERFQSLLRAVMSPYEAISRGVAGPVSETGIVSPRSAETIGEGAAALASMIPPVRTVRAIRSLGVRPPTPTVQDILPVRPGLPPPEPQLALPSPAMVAQAERAATIDQLLTEAERFRQSPQGAQLLRRELAGQEILSQPTTQAVGDIFDQITTAMPRRQAPLQIGPGRRLTAESAATSELAQDFAPKAPAIELPPPERPKIVMGQSGYRGAPTETRPMREPGPAVEPTSDIRERLGLFKEPPPPETMPPPQPKSFEIQDLLAKAQAKADKKVEKLGIGQRKQPVRQAELPEDVSQPMAEPPFDVTEKFDAVQKELRDINLNRDVVFDAALQKRRGELLAQREQLERELPNFGEQMQARRAAMEPPPAVQKETPTTARTKAEIGQDIDSLVSEASKRMNSGSAADRARRPTERDWMTRPELRRIDELQAEYQTAPTQVATFTKQAIPEAGPTPEVVGAGKNPWEMTQRDYRHTRYNELADTLESQGKDKIAARARLPNVQDGNTEQSQSFNYAHKVEVEDALKQGKAVPPSVLAEYPDLQPTPPKRTPLDILKEETGALRVPGRPQGEPGPVSQTRLILGGLGEESTKTLQRTMGPEGAELGRLAKAVRNEAEIDANTAKTLVNKELRGMNPKQLDNLVDVLEGKAKPIDRKVAQAFNVARREDDKVAARTSAAGIQTTNPLTGEKYPFTPLKDHYPHMFEKELGVYIRDPYAKAQIKADIKAKLEAGGKEVSDKQVEQALTAMVKATKGRDPHLEIARVFNRPDYSRDVKKVLNKHFTDAYRRIHIAEKFGPDLKKGEELLTAIGRVGGPGDLAEEFARTYFERVTGTAKVNRLAHAAVNTAVNVNNFTKLGQAAIANASQPVYTAVVAGAKNAAKGYGAAMTKEGREFASKILGDSAREFYEDIAAQGKGFSGKAADAVLRYNGFNFVERGNRIVAANAGKYFARDMFEKLLANPTNKKARDTLAKMNVDVDAALKRGALNEADELRAGQNIINRTQFKTDVTELPLFWSSEPGRLLTQYKRFQFKTGQLVKDEIIKEAAKGNVMPLVRAAAILPIAGAGVVTVKDAIRWGPQSEQTRNLADYLGAVGTFGAFGDAFTGYGRQPVKGLSWLAGPTLGTVGGALDASRILLQEGDIKPAGKMIAGAVPVAGPSLRGLFNKPKSQKQQLLEDLGLTHMLKEQRGMNKELREQLGLE